MTPMLHQNPKARNCVRGAHAISGFCFSTVEVQDVSSPLVEPQRVSTSEKWKKHRCVS